MNDMTHPAEKPDKNANFPALLTAYKGEIARALPKHMDGERMARIALTEFRKNPKLGECEPRSVFAAVIVASQLGLEPGVLGQAFLVPYSKNTKVRGEWVTTTECQLIPGWQGLADLVARAGRASVWTGAVYEGDEFDYAQGDRPFITHKELAEDQSEAKLTHCYAVGRIKNSEWPVIEVWTAKKIRAHLARYNKQGEKHYALKGNLEMYGRKVALLQVIKYMPKSPDLGTAVELEHAAGGRQNLADAKEVIQGTWAPAPDEPEENDGAVESAKADAKPVYPADQFATELPKWRKTIASGKKKAEDVIATAEAKYTLSDAQKAEIRSPAGAASPAEIQAMWKKAEEATLSKADVLKAIGSKEGDTLSEKDLSAALAFIADPVGGSK